MGWMRRQKDELRRSATRSAGELKICRLTIQIQARVRTFRGRCPRLLYRSPAGIGPRSRIRQYELIPIRPGVWSDPSSPRQAEHGLLPATADDYAGRGPPSSLGEGWKYRGVRTRPRNHFPLRGGEGELPPALSPAGAARVRGHFLAFSTDAAPRHPG